jgi:hypothetical protein
MWGELAPPRPPRERRSGARPRARWKATRVRRGRGPNSPSAATHSRLAASRCCTAARRGCARPAARPVSRAGRPPAGSPCRAARVATWRRSGPAPAGWAPPPSGPSPGTCRRWARANRTATAAGDPAPPPPAAARPRPSRRPAARSERPAPATPADRNTGGFGRADGGAGRWHAAALLLERSRPAPVPEPPRMSTGPRARRGGNPLRRTRWGLWTTLGTGPGGGLWTTLGTRPGGRLPSRKGPQ